jgi:TPR repeat protein
MNAAKVWLQKAAKQGDNRASYNLALIEERNQNLSSAYQWYDLASRDGMLDKNVSKQAQGKILKLAANLSQQDILAARDRADRWFQTAD